MNVCVIIPAAGRSRRFGPSDKLGQDLGGRPLLVRTVELFAKRDEVRSIVVAGPPGDAEEPEAFATFKDRYAATLGFHGAQVVEGGAIDRWETVKNAIAAVPDDATHIAVHDAARPGASAALISRVFDAAASGLDAVIPALPVRSTVKRLDKSEDEVSPGEDDVIADSILGDSGKVTLKVHRVLETIDRAGLAEIQTPQIFTATLLRRAYAEAETAGATDDASLVERLGETVHTVEGEARNFKVTAPDDLQLIRAVLGLKAPEERPVHKRF